MERQGQLFKEMAYKVMEQISCKDWDTWKEVIDITRHMPHQEPIVESRWLLARSKGIRVPTTNFRRARVRRKRRSTKVAVLPET